MANWFECKVSYDKMLENGLQKRVTEPYLVDALSFTEAEARIIEELKPFITGEFVVADIKRARIAELFFFDGGDRFYRSKIQFITLDEKSASEKKSSVSMVVQASDLDQALKVLSKGMEGTMADYNSVAIAETAIMDVFPYGDSKKSIVLDESKG